MHIAFLLIAISLIVINYSFYQSISKCNKKIGYNIAVFIPIKDNKQNTKNLLRRDNCYLNKTDNCRMGLRSSRGSCDQCLQLSFVPFC